MDCTIQDFGKGKSLKFKFKDNAGTTTFCTAWNQSNLSPAHVSTDITESFNFFKQNFGLKFILNVQVNRKRKRDDKPINFVTLLKIQNT